MISAELLSGYSDSRRPAADRTVLCHAPFVSLNFEQTGMVTACCYNRKIVLGRYPEQSVREIWTGDRARQLRETFLEHREAKGCEICFMQVASGNFAGTLMRSFDKFSESDGYRALLDMPAPIVLEFEISNTCNLECVMCAGLWSSSIRSRREKLPPLRSPYDREFTRQLEEFLPNVMAARFLGGEPFLIRRYYDVWESIARLNPKAAVSITTNASFLPQRARDVLEALQADIVISLDAVTKDTYERIRVNADFDVVMEHVEYLLDYTRRKKTGFSLAVCPMTYNWRELDRVVAFCEERRIGLHFNTVMRPAHASLGGLSPDQLREVVAHLRTIAPTEPATPFVNGPQVAGLVRQLEEWTAEKTAFAGRCQVLADEMRAFVRTYVLSDAVPALPGQVDALLDVFARAHLIELERAGYDYFELRDLLARTAFAGDVNIDEVSDRDAILGAQVFTRFPVSRGGDSDWLRSQPRLEYVTLCHALNLAPNAEGYSTARVQELALWIRQQLRESNVSIIQRRMTAMLESLKEVSESTQGAAAIRNRLSNSLAGLRENGFSEEVSARIGAHVEGMMVNDGRLPSSLLADEGSRAPSGSQHAIASAKDLGEAFEALYVYHQCVSPADTHAAFRRRVDFVLTQIVTPERAAVFFDALTRTSLNEAYGFLVRSTDEELDVAARSMQ